MLESGKYQFVHKFFDKMLRSGIALKAITYKGSNQIIYWNIFLFLRANRFLCVTVLVKTLWKEGKIDEAVETIRSMEERGVVGSAGVYYELACCLCNNGRWKEAMVEVYYSLS